MTAHAARFGVGLALIVAAASPVLALDVPAAGQYDTRVRVVNYNPMQVYYLRNVNSGHPGSITTLHANSAMLAFEQLTLLVKESEAGRDLTRDDIRELLFQLVDVVMQVHKVEGGGRQVTEIYFDPHRKLQCRH